MRCDECFRPLSKEKDAIHYTIEVMTFSKLLEYAKIRHMPFFDKLFGK